MDRCIGGRGEFEKFYFPVKSDHFLPYSRYSALARGLVKEAPLGCRGWRDFPFSCQTRSFPATSAAFCVGERVGSGGASWGVRAGEIFHFPAKPGHFLPHLPHSALARGLVREAPLGISGLARFSIFLPNPVISCHIRPRPADFAAFGWRRLGSGSSNNSASDAVGARPVFRLHSSSRFIGR